MYGARKIWRQINREGIPVTHWTGGSPENTISPIPKGLDTLSRRLYQHDSPDIGPGLFFSRLPGVKP